MARPSKYTPELRERAVRMVIESRPDYEHETAAIKSWFASDLAIEIGVWIRQHLVGPPQHTGGSGHVEAPQV